MIWEWSDYYLGAPRGKGGVRFPTALGFLLLVLPGWKKLMVYW